MNMSEIVAAQIAAKQAEREALVAELEALPEKAKAENRSLPDTEVDTAIAAVAAVDAELDTLSKRQAELAELASRAQAAAVVPQSPTVFTRTNVATQFDGLPARDMTQLDAGEARTRALHAFENMRMNEYGKEQLLKEIDEGGRAGAHLARLALATGSEEYRAAFDQWARDQNGLTYEQRSLLSRGMTSGTASSGGVMVPIQIDPTLVITGNGTYSPVNMLATQKTTAGASYYGFNAGALTASGVISEGGANTPVTPTTTQVLIPIYKFAFQVNASFEAMDDIDNLQGELGQLFLRGVADTENPLLTTGSGSSTITGIVTAIGGVSGSRVAATTTGSFGLVDIYKLMAGLPPSARLGAPANQRAFLANITTINTIRQFATANNYHAFLTDATGGNPPVLFGDQFFEAPSMTATVTTGVDLMLYADFSRYYVVRKRGFSVEYIPNVVDGSGYSTGERGFLGWWRLGAGSADTNSGRTLRI